MASVKIEQIHEIAEAEGDRLEELADAELRAHGFRFREAQLFSERGILRKIKKDLARMPNLPEDDLPDEVCEYLIDRHIAHRLKTIGCTGFQRKVYSLFLRGLPIAQITDMLRVSRQRVTTAILIVRRRARATVDRYDGLHEVYWREVRRTVYRKPRHGWQKRERDEE